MPRYIDADQIEKYVTREDHGTPDEMWRTEREFCAIGDSIPTADVREVKHGRWEVIRNPYGELEGWICKCGRQVVSKDNYCPNCGAKMD